MAGEAWLPEGVRPTGLVPRGAGSQLHIPPPWRPPLGATCLHSCHPSCLSVTLPTRPPRTCHALSPQTWPGACTCPSPWAHWPSLAFLHFPCPASDARRCFLQVFMPAMCLLGGWSIISRFTFLQVKAASCFLTQCCGCFVPAACRQPGWEAEGGSLPPGSALAIRPGDLLQSSLSVTRLGAW